MNPKAIEKAKELFDRYCWAIRIDETDSGYYSNVIYAKDCALIAVGEMLDILYESPAKNIKEIAFCIDVTNEIKKL
jgi:hypothetical protein